MKIAVAGVGEVGLSTAVLLARENDITAVTTTEKKAAMLSRFVSPVQDAEIDLFFAEVREGKRVLRLRATTDAEAAFSSAEAVIVCVPTRFHSENDFYDTAVVEDVIERTLCVNPSALIVIRSSVPVGYTEEVRQQYRAKVLYSPVFTRQGKALYDQLFPGRIIVGRSRELEQEAELFARFLQHGALKADVPMLLTGSSEAETVAAFTDEFLSRRCSYFTRISAFAGKNGLAGDDILRCLCLDPQIGSYYKGFAEETQRVPV